MLIRITRNQDLELDRSKCDKKNVVIQENKITKITTISIGFKSNDNFQRF